MVEVLPFPWETLRHLQEDTDSFLVNSYTKGKEEALCSLVEELAAGMIPSDAEAMERRYRTLSTNRSAKYRYRSLLGGQIAYERQVQHSDYDPIELITLKQLTVLVSAELAAQEWELLREIGNGASYLEVARKLDVPIGTVKARVSRLRHKLRNVEVAGIIRQVLKAA
jgi:DNA-binding NarL/FixJ family response regulator